MKKIKNKYYKQIMLALILVSLCPVIFLGGSIYRLVREQMDSLYGTLQDSAEKEKNHYEVIFQYLDAQLLQLALDTDFNNIIGREMVAENFQIFNIVQNGVQIVSNLEESLNEVYLINISKNWIVRPVGKQILEADIMQEYEKFEHDKKNTFYVWDEDTVSLCKRVPLFSYNNSGLLIAEFDKTRLMGRAKEDQVDYRLLVLNSEDGRLVLEDDGAWEIWDEIRADEEKMNGLRNERYTSIQVGRESYIVAMSQSNYNGWEYIVFASVSELNKSMSSVLVFLTFTVISMLLLGLFIIMIMSRRLYSPIDEIDSIIRKNLNMPYTGGELMDNLRELIKNNVDMNKRILISQENNKQLFLRRVYLGEAQKISREEFVSYGIEVPEEPSVYYVVLIRYSKKFQQKSDRYLYQFMLDNIVRELIEQKECFEPIFIHGTMYLTCVIPNTIEANAAIRIQTMVNLMFNTINCYVDIPINMAVSDKVYELSGIPDGVWQAQRVLQDNIGVNGGIQFYTEQKREYIIAADSRIQQLRMGLLKSLEEGNREEVEKNLPHYMAKLKNIKYYQIKLELYALITEILNIDVSYGITPNYEKISGLMDFGIGHAVESFETLEQSMKEDLMEPLLAAADSQMKQQNIIYKIVEYLNNNIDKDVSLEQCARQFNYNANYLSRMFKQKFGKTYTEYVVELKVEKCKELLIKTNVSVNDLAFRFGYSSPQNFIRVFKKYTLMTPGQFRKQYGTEK